MTVAEEVLATAASWNVDGPVAMATVVSTTGSAPRTPGAAMAVSTDGAVVGSVSSGCIESALYELCQESLRTGEAGLHRFGAGDGFYVVGPTCGGEIEVLVQRLERDDLTGHAGAVESGESVTVETVLEHPDPTRVGTRRLVSSSARRRTVGVRTFVQTWASRPRLLVFGASDFAAALADVGRALGRDVTVCDARPVFTTPERFPSAHRVVVDRPDRYLHDEIAAGRVDDRTAVCVLTHDARFDVPALLVALRARLGYVGAMGSRRTHADRLERLLAAGVTRDDLVRLRSPIGLDLGARTPEEVALSIVAEIVADHRGAESVPMSRRTPPRSVASVG